MIGSPSNPRIKAAAALRRRTVRLGTALFLIEGRQEIGQALLAGVEIQDLFALEGTNVPEQWRQAGLTATVVGPEAFSRIAYGRDGLVAVGRRPEFDLDSFAPLKPELILLTERIEKPGNLGAMMRSADAAGAAMLVADPVTDLTNPNVVRASLGTVFAIPLAVSTIATATRWLADRQVPLLAATVDDGPPPWEVDLTTPVALAIGAEHQGLSNHLMATASNRIHIPMAGSSDSLNASTTAAILLFESVRQRSSHR